MEHDSVYTLLTDQLKLWIPELGFQAHGITDTDLGEHEDYLRNWLAKGYHGEMSYMQHHGSKRSRPAELLPGTLTVISVRMDYLPAPDAIAETLKDKNRAYVSRYALGRDYHKVIRSRLRKLELKIAEFLEQHDLAGFSARVFTDSAPLLEKAIAQQAGLGWIGKNTLLLNKKAGSWFFLGEILTNLPLAVTHAEPIEACGACQACIKVCPTDAIIAPYQLDARKCISYLTIENRGEIPIELRSKIGNRIFGCDDCQAVCPWNRYAQTTTEKDFSPRHKLDQATLVELFNWSESEFLQNTEGSAIRRTGYQGWLRNLSIALGNAEYSEDVVTALMDRLPDVTPLVADHIDWAIAQQTDKLNNLSNLNRK